MNAVFEIAPPDNIRYTFFFFLFLAFGMLSILVFYRVKKKFADNQNLSFGYQVFCPLVVFIVFIVNVPVWFLHNISYSYYINDKYESLSGYINEYETIGASLYFQIAYKGFIIGFEESSCLSGKELSRITDKKINLYFYSFNRPKPDGGYRKICIVKVESEK